MNVKHLAGHTEIGHGEEGRGAPVKYPPRLQSVMALGDRRLLSLIESGRLVIDPLRPDAIQQNGVDLRIGAEAALPEEGEGEVDLLSPDPSEYFRVVEIPDGGLVVPPRTPVLLHTEEYLRLPEDVAAICELRSTLARFGFIAPPTVVDAGFEGQLTIEVFWSGLRPARIYRGLRFLHVVFFEVVGGVERPYSGSYQGQRGVRLPKSLRGELS